MQLLLPGSSGVWACDSRRCPLTQLFVPHSLLCPDTSYCPAAETPATSGHWLFHWVTIHPDLVASDNSHHFICAKPCRSGSRAGSRAGFRWVVLPRWAGGLRPLGLALENLASRRLMPGVGWIPLSLHMALYMCSWREEEEHSISIALSWKLHFCILMVKVCPGPAEMQRGGLKSTL